MARIAIVLGPDFEDSEFDVPRSTLQERGHDVMVVGVSTDEQLTGKRGDVTVDVDRAVSDVDLGQVDALVIPGGYSPDHLRTDEAMVRFVRDVAGRGVPVAAICHAGSLLIEADLVEGRTVTSWPSIRTDLVNAGAAWVDEEVVVDGNLITSRNPDDLDAFVDAIDGALAPHQVGAV
jgi:protease I